MATVAPDSAARAAEYQKLMKTVRAQSPANRAKEQKTIQTLMDGLVAAGFKRLSPSAGLSIKTDGDDVIACFLPGTALVVWASPVIDFHFPGIVLGGNIDISLSLGGHPVTEEHRAQIAAAILEHTDGHLRVQEYEAGNVQVDGWSTVAPPQRDGLRSFPATMELRLYQRPKTLDVTDWAQAVWDACAQLVEILSTDNDTAPRLDSRFRVLDITRICYLISERGSSRKTLAYPPSIVESLNELLDPSSGSTMSIYAGWEDLWLMDEYPLAMPEEDRQAG